MPNWDKQTIDKVLNDAVKKQDKETRATERVTAIRDRRRIAVRA